MLRQIRLTVAYVLLTLGPAIGIIGMKVSQARGDDRLTIAGTVMVVLSLMLFGPEMREGTPASVREFLNTVRIYSGRGMWYMGLTVMALGQFMPPYHDQPTDLQLMLVIGGLMTVAISGLFHIPEAVTYIRLRLKTRFEEDLQ